MIILHLVRVYRSTTSLYVTDATNPFSSADVYGIIKLLMILIDIDPLNQYEV